MLPTLDPTASSGMAGSLSMLLAIVTAKGFVLLLMALGISAAMRRAPAAARHLMWFATAAAMLMLPLLGSTLPVIDLPILPATASTATADDTAPRAVLFAAQPGAMWTDANGLVQPADPETYLVRIADVPNDPTFAAFVDPAPLIDQAADASLASWGMQRLVDSIRSWSILVWAVLIWETGMLLVGLWFVVGFLRVRVLQRRSHPITDRSLLALADSVAAEMGLHHPPHLVSTDEAMTPLTWGFIHAVVLLPAQAQDWSNDRLRDVLRHEFAHVHRRDVLTQLIAQITCTVFWFHPLAWVAASRMRLERERACDDRVLLAGSRASSYAGHLLDMARSLRSEHSLAAATIGMARRSQLGERMETLLDESPRGRKLGRLGGVAIVAGLVLLVLPLAALRPAAEAAPPENDERERFFAPAPPALPRLVRTPLPQLRQSAVPRVPRAPGVPRVSPPGYTSRIEQLRGRLAQVRRGAPRASFPVDSPLKVTANRIRLLSNGRLALREFNGDGGISGSGTFSSTNGHLALLDGTMWRGVEHRDLEHRSIDADDYEFQFRNDDEDLEVALDGELRFADDDRSVELLGDRAYFDLEQDEGRDRRRVEIELRKGETTRRYFENGREKDMDANAEDWFGTTLERFLVTSGIGAEDRVQGWLDEGGVDGAIEELEAIEFDMAVSHHASFLITNDDLEPDERRRVVEAVGELVHSDFERSRLLHSVLDLDDLSEELMGDILALTGDLDSDFERARTLRHFVRVGGENGKGYAPMVIDLSRGLDNDFERSNVLIDVLPLALDDDEARQRMWVSIEEIDSEFERSNVLLALARKVEDDPEMALEALEVLDSFDSDFERGRVLRAYANAAANDASVREAYVRAAEQIDSDHEYGQALSALRSAER